MRNLFIRVYQNLVNRIQLRRICKRLRIKPFAWQRRFILGMDDRLEFPPGRGTGKTTAVLLRLLMLRRADYFEASRILHCDPDFSDGYSRRYDWYWQEYLRLAELCGVNPVLDFRRFYVGSGRHG